MRRRTALLCRIAAVAVAVAAVVALAAGAACDAPPRVVGLVRQDPDAGATADVDGGADDAAPPGACLTLPDSLATCPAAPPSFATDVVPILDRRCNNCHDASLPDAPWPLHDFIDVWDWRSPIAADLVNCTMPPPDSGNILPESERELVMSWIVCDAPNN